jgi:hypothetical protein
MGLKGISLIIAFISFFLILNLISDGIHDSCIVIKDNLSEQLLFLKIRDEIFMSNFVSDSSGATRSIVNNSIILNFSVPMKRSNLWTDAISLNDDRIKTLQSDLNNQIKKCNAWQFLDKLFLYIALILSIFEIGLYIKKRRNKK